MNRFTSPVTNVVRRVAVPGIVFLLVLAANSGLFAAQCGGFPKGWKPVGFENETVQLLTETPVERLSKPTTPAAPARSCHCEGSKCAPAAPPSAPDRSVTWSVSTDAHFVGASAADRAVVSPEFPAAVNSQIRYEVVLGLLRPPCGC